MQTYKKFLEMARYRVPFDLSVQDFITKVDQALNNNEITICEYNVIEISLRMPLF